jgi:predicted NBD/HSP70 family sugar kinase
MSWGVRKAMRINDQEANRLLVLKTIRRAEPVARTDLVKLTGLSNGTITEVVADLVRRKFLLEAKAPAVGRGRPRVQLMLNPDAAYVLGAFWLPNGAISAEISNLRGDRLFGRTVALGPIPSIAAIAERIAAILEETIAESPFERTQIHSVGVAVPAVLDNIGGVIHWLQTYPIEPIAFASTIEQRLGLPVTIDNNVGVMARAEHWFGEGRQVDDFSLIVVALTVGMAQYVDGMLRTGAGGMSTEFAHVKIALDQGPVCTCGQRGCQGMLASGHGVILRICEARGCEVPSILKMPKALAAFAREAQAGEPVAREAFEFAGRVLGTAVANHVNATLPPRVKVVLLHPEMADLIAAPFYAALQENTLPVFRGRTAVELKAMHEARYSHGAAAIVLERLYRVAEEHSLPAPA